MLNDPHTRRQIDEYLEQRDKNFNAQQTIKINQEIDAREDRSSKARHRRILSVTAILGVLGIGAVTFAVEAIKSTALRTTEQAVKDQIEPALRKLHEAETRLREAEKKLSDINNQIGNSLIVYERTRKLVRNIVSDATEALGKAKMAEGGVSIAGDLARIYKELELIRGSSPGGNTGQAGASIDLPTDILNTPLIEVKPKSDSSTSEDKKKGGG